jgi:hypothetical protein
MIVIHNAIRYLKNKLNKGQQEIQKEYKSMTDEEFIQFHNERLAELEPWIVEKSVKVLQEELVSCTLLEETRKLYKEDPVHWMSPYHFYTGMAIRNLLRDKVCLDGELTTKEEYKNWDNVYVQIMEIAAGVRSYDRKS